MPWTLEFYLETSYIPDLEEHAAVRQALAGSSHRGAVDAALAGDDSLRLSLGERWIALAGQMPAPAVAERLQQQQQPSPPPPPGTPAVPVEATRSPKTPQRLKSMFAERGRMSLRKLASGKKTNAQQGGNESRWVGCCHSAPSRCSLLAWP